MGQETSLDHGREQLEILAGLKVTAQSVEHGAEALGAVVVQGEQVTVQQALRLDLWFWSVAKFSSWMCK